jgi:hypothetical protein
VSALYRKPAPLLFHHGAVGIPSPSDGSKGAFYGRLLPGDWNHWLTLRSSKNWADQSASAIRRRGFELIFGAAILADAG